MTHGVALPHLRLPDLEHPEMVLVRARSGVDIPIEDGTVTGHPEALPTAGLVGLTLREAHLPEGALIAVLRRRQGRILVPSGGTRLREGGRLTIIGTPGRIRELEAGYCA